MPQRRAIIYYEIDDKDKTRTVKISENNWDDFVRYLKAGAEKDGVDAVMQQY
jgi:hypothetical protein